MHWKATFLIEEAFLLTLRWSPLYHSTSGTEARRVLQRSASAAVLQYQSCSSKLLTPVTTSYFVTRVESELLHVWDHIIKAWDSWSALSASRLMLYKLVCSKMKIIMKNYNDLNLNILSNWYYQFFPFKVHYDQSNELKILKHKYKKQFK